MFNNFIEGLHGFIFFNPVYKFYIKEFEFKKNEQKELLIELEKKE